LVRRGCEHGGEMGASIAVTCVFEPGCWARGVHAWLLGHGCVHDCDMAVPAWLGEDHTSHLVCLYMAGHFNGGFLEGNAARHREATHRKT
jgi:hypothetical protein